MKERQLEIEQSSTKKDRLLRGKRVRWKTEDEKNNIGKCASSRTRVRCVRAVSIGAMDPTHFGYDRLENGAGEPEPDMSQS